MADVDIGEVTDNRPLTFQGSKISQAEPLTLTAPISVYLPLLENEYVKYPAERAALLALYNSTNGGDWINNTGWGTNSWHCDWYGVNCDENEQVTILDLGENWLTGALPSEIGNLPMLTVLGLTGTTSSNKIGDTIYAKLSGSLPPEMGNLANLQTLYLDLNDFVSLAPEIGNLYNLQVLTLGSNQLTPLPPELGNLANLQWLYLSYNKLSGPTPAFLSNLGNLSTLYLTGNPLSCWETEEARDWALSLDVYVGSTCFFP